eukprot:4079111-Pyramimonas_sp.AAC.1
MAGSAIEGYVGRGGCNDLSRWTGDSSDWGTPQKSALRKLRHNTAKQASNCGVPRKMGAREQGF